MIFVKKYVLDGGRASNNFVTENLSELIDKLLLLKSEVSDLGNFKVTLINTEKYPPVVLSAEDFLEQNQVEEALPESRGDAAEWKPDGCIARLFFELKKRLS